MATIVGVRFRNAGKLYYFSPGQLWPTAGDAVIVETVRGVEYGEVVTGVRDGSRRARWCTPLKKVIRIATVEDERHQRDNQRRESEAYDICLRKIAEHKLEMKLVSVEYTFDNSKILFYFHGQRPRGFPRAGEGSGFGVQNAHRAAADRRARRGEDAGRPRARAAGPICCGAFLGDFQPVSIKMAKEQNLSLNPTKISGLCGRLMCCLKYEQDHYEATRKRMPRPGREVGTPDGVGTVQEINVLRETVRVRITNGDSSELKDYPLTDITRILGGKRTPSETIAEPEDDSDVNEEFLGVAENETHVQDASVPLDDE